MEKTNKILSVKDLSVAENFYCGLLGRRIKERHINYLLLDGGIVLQKAVNCPGQIALSIKNFDRLLEGLCAEHTIFTENGLRRIQLHDPDGNTLLLCEDAVVKAMRYLADGWAPQQIERVLQLPLSSIEQAQQRLQTFHILHGADIKSQASHYIQEIRAIESLVYPPHLISSITGMQARYQCVEDSFILLMHEQRLAAYINIFPMHDSLYHAVLTDDTIHDDDIRPEDIQPYAQHQLNHLYIFSIAMHPDYHGSDAIIALSGELVRFLREKEEQGFAIGSISATTVSDAGRRTATALGLQPVRQINGGYVVYSAQREAVRQMMYRCTPLRNGFHVHATPHNRL